MSMLFALLLSAIAGLMNGSFASPVRRMREWREENIWLAFSILTFLILPYLILICFPYHLHEFLKDMPRATMLILLISGFIFGVGMILFMISLRFLGIGITFLLNISMNTLIGAIGPLLISGDYLFFSLFGLMQVFAMLIFIAAIVLAWRATIKRENIDFAPADNRHIKLGLWLAILSGLCTSAQGLAYNVTALTMQELAIETGSSAFFGANVAWLPLFGAAFIPYSIYFAVLNFKKHLYVNYFKKSTHKYWLFLLGMAILYFMSVILFGKASTLLGRYGALLAWPLFMIFIILTSNFWGWRQGEWKKAKGDAILLQKSSIGLMILAIITLAINGYLHGQI